MNTPRPSALAALLASLLLAACSQPAPSSTTASTPDPLPAADSIDGTIAGAVGGAIDEARREIREGNISLSRSDGDAHAEITPAGDLLIEGRKVETTPEQRALLLAHRAHIAAVAEAGMQVGLEGAGLAKTAVKEALKGVFSSDPGSVDVRVEAEAEKIKASVRGLCSHLPALMASQQRVAAALPEFRPYATMTADEIDECGVDLDSGNAAEMAAAAG